MSVVFFLLLFFSLNCRPKQTAKQMLISMHAVGYVWFSTSAPRIKKKCNIAAFGVTGTFVCQVFLPRGRGKQRLADEETQRVTLTLFVCLPLLSPTSLWYRSGRRPRRLKSIFLVYSHCRLSTPHFWFYLACSIAIRFILRDSDLSSSLKWRCSFLILRTLMMHLFPHCELSVFFIFFSFAVLCCNPPPHSVGEVWRLLTSNHHCQFP